VETLAHEGHLLNPIRYGIFAWKLISHKVCRWLLPVTVIPSVIGLLLLAATQWWAVVALVGVALLGILAGVGVFWPAGRSMPRPISIVAFGVAGNLAVVHALCRVVYGHHDHIWEPTRRTASPVAE
jgi:hypothetical protein